MRTRAFNRSGARSRSRSRRGRSSHVPQHAVLLSIAACWWGAVESPTGICAQPPLAPNRQLRPTGLAQNMTLGQRMVPLSMSAWRYRWWWTNCATCIPSKKGVKCTQERSTTAQPLRRGSRTCVSTRSGADDRGSTHVASHQWLSPIGHDVTQAGHQYVASGGPPAPPPLATPSTPQHIYKQSVAPTHDTAE